MQSNVSTPAETVSTKFLMKFVMLSVVTAVRTVAIKASAAWITGSVGFLSDALESIVNLVAALVALWALAGARVVYWGLRLSARPAPGVPAGAPPVVAAPDAQALARLLGAGPQAPAAAAPAPAAAADPQGAGVDGRTAAGGVRAGQG